MTLAILDMWVREHIPDETPYYVQPALRPCPFCGERVWYRHGGKRSFGERYHEVICVRCSMSMVAFSRDAVVARWNLRSPKAADAPTRQPEAEREELRTAYEEAVYRNALYDNYRNWRIVNWAMRMGVVPIDGARMWESRPEGTLNLVKIDDEEADA